MDESPKAWERRLIRRRDDKVPWNTIANEEGVHVNTFRDGRKRAVRNGLLPPEDQLPPAVRSDGKRVGTRGKSAETEPVSTSVDMSPVSTAPVSGIPDLVPEVISAPLSSDEAQILEHYEEIIERGIKTFVEVGRALMTIRDRKLYRVNYATFEAYCRERWDLSRPYAYQLIDASVVVENLSGITDIVPANEAQAQPLTSLPPEAQMEVWAEVVKTAPASGVTAKHVKATVSRVKGQTTGATQAKPAATAPEPRRPARLEVQEGLIWGLREIADDNAWPLLVRIWDGLNDVAPEYKSLRGMLDRVRRRFPDEHKTMLAKGFPVQRD